jgi:urea ABC transporter ATP-binding protein UrtE
MLEVKELKSGYGKVQILNAVSIKVKKGEIVSIIGRNGVGKSTFVKTIIGILPVNDGRISFPAGIDVTKWPAHKRAREGMGYVPQGHGIFPQLTVRENLEIGALINNKEKEEAYERVYSYFPRLGERHRQSAGTMSGGEQAMLSIGRVLVNKPKIILLDEPSEGVQPNIVYKMGEIVKQISEDLGLTVLMIEQHLGLIQQISQRAYVMDKGNLIEMLTKEQINDDDEVSRYLSV